MDITPLVPSGRKLIEAYGDGGFRIGGERVTGSALVFAERVLPWAPTTFADITFESLAPVVGAGIELLLLGCGAHLMLPSPRLRARLRAAGVGLEPMDTGAACRTFNVLLAEERRVAAALIAT